MCSKYVVDIPIIGYKDKLIILVPWSPERSKLMKRTNYLSVIIPVYNEEESIPLLHERLKKVLREQNFSYEVIYVDDGSIDQTHARLLNIAMQDPQVRVIQLRRNFGQTAAISAGVDASTGEVLVLMDGDLQNDPIDIPRLLAKLDEGYDVVSGWRKDRKDARISRKLPSWLANRLISQVTGIHLHDYGCTLKAFRWEVFQHLHLYGEMHRFLPAYASLAGAAITEIEVTHHPRRFGVSKYGISRTIRVILDLMTLKFLGRFGTKPMHAFGGMGLLLMLLGILTAGMPLSQIFLPRCTDSKSFGNNATFQTNSTSRRNLAPLFLGFGMQGIMMGLMAEVLVRIYHESQGKPTYTIKAEFPLPGGKHEKEKYEAAA